MTTYRMPEWVLEGWPNPEDLQEVIGTRFWIKRPKDTGRYIFLAFFPRPPWSCGFCDEPILYVGREGDCLIVHHADENRDNNRLINLMPCHQSCHIRYHQRQGPPQEV